MIDWRVKVFLDMILVEKNILLKFGSGKKNIFFILEFSGKYLVYYLIILKKDLYWMKS